MAGLHPIRFDREGKPIRVPSWFDGTYEEFADLVDRLEPHHCSYPNGATMDRKTRKPCTDTKVVHDACSKHCKSKARKGLRYAKYLSKELGQRMAEAHIDADLLSIGHDVEFLQIRLTQLMERLDTGESRDAWNRLREVWEEFREAQKEQAEALKARNEAEAAEDEEEFKRCAALMTKWAGVATNCIRSVDKIITEAADNEEAWNEAIELSERVANLKSRETARRKEAGLTLNVEQAFALVQQLSDIVTQEVDDKAARANIAVRFAAVIGVASPMFNRSSAPKEATKFDGFAKEHPADTTSKALTVEQIIERHVT